MRQEMRQVTCDKWRVLACSIGLALLAALLAAVTPAFAGKVPRGGGVTDYGLRVRADAGWTDSGWSVTAGDFLTVDAQGLWSNGGEQRGPDGFEGYLHPATVVADAPLASLVGRIGDQVFAIGRHREFAAPGTGRLELAINDDFATLADNQGSVRVDISRSDPVTFDADVPLPPPAPCDCAEPTVHGTCYVPGTANCSAGDEQSGEFCYPACRAGFTGIGPVCWKQCPDGYHDDGAFCRRDVEITWKDHYGRGAGYALWQEEDCRRDNPGGCEKNGLLWYPTCREGYENVGCCLCRQKGCPEGMTDDGASCRRDVHIFAKETYTRGAGTLKRDDYHGIFYRYIRDHRNIWQPSADPLTVEESAYLKRFFPAELVDRVRVVELEGMTGAFNHSASATTYGDLVVVRKGERSNRLLKHELVHVCQYDRFGLQGFADRYADQYVDQGTGPAMCFESQAYSYAAISDDATPTVGSQLGYCN